MKTQIWAHRGASYYAPENTLVAFKKAIHMGADGIELDIQMTKDGEIVVIHDETIKRTSNGKGYVKELTLYELKQYDFSYGFIFYRGQKIPTLREVLELVLETPVVINIELKNSIIRYEGMEEKVLELVEEMGLKDRVIYSSFNHESLCQIKKIDAHAKTGLLYSEEWLGVAEYGKIIDVYALHPAGHLLREAELIKDARAKGLALHVWTIDKRKDMHQLIKIGVDAIITNRPDICRKIVDTNG